MVLMMGPKTLAEVAIVKELGVPVRQVVGKDANPAPVPGAGRLCYR